MMITHATLETLRYIIASAYVLLPAAMLLLCGLMARFQPRLDLEEPSGVQDDYVAFCAAQRDVFATFAVAMLAEVDSCLASGRYLGALSALLKAYDYRYRAVYWHELAT